MNGGVPEKLPTKGNEGAMELIISVQCRGIKVEVGRKVSYWIF
jgi:hypothetical protein